MSGNVLTKSSFSVPPVEGIGREAEIYSRRFTDKEFRTREATWRALCKNFLQQFISPDSTVIDLGAGEGHFLLNIQAKRKIAVDLSSQVKELEGRGIEICMVPGTELSHHVHGIADLVFMSNFLEHLPDKKTLLIVLEECRKALKPGGRVMILQPNIRYAKASYWDYVDHHIALTEHSLAEALDVTGFKVEKLIPKFLPYTAKSKTGFIAGLLGTERLVQIYLRLPILWKIFGSQTFVIASVRSK